MRGQRWSIHVQPVSQDRHLPVTMRLELLPASECSPYSAQIIQQRNTKAGNYQVARQTRCLVGNNVT